MYQRAVSDRPGVAQLASYMSGLPSFQSDWWQCMPDPLSP